MKRVGSIRGLVYFFLIPILLLFSVTTVFANDHDHGSHVVPGTYGNATNVGQFTVNRDGEITAAANVAIQLANTGVVAGSYTNANITVGADGRITAASSGSASGVAPDSLDFTDFKDAMSVDAPTTIDTSSNDLTIGDPTSGGLTVTSTGVGIGTTTPDAEFSVNGRMGIASGDAVFVSCSGSGIIPMSPTANGVASRTAGQIILPGGTTSAVICTVTFNFAYSHSPICTVSQVTATGGASPQLAMVENGSIASNQIAVLVDSAFGAGDGFNYICMDH